MNFPFFLTQRLRDSATQRLSHTESEQTNDNALIDSIAAAIVRRGMEMPAVLFLEFNRPLAFLYSQGLHFATPLLGVFAAPEKVSRLAYLLDSPDKVEQLIGRIEELAHKSKETKGKNSEL